MDQRENFIKDVRFKAFNISELCERHGISRKTAYKWLGRFEEEGRAGLQDRRRVPKTCPHRIDEGVAYAICQVRRKHPTWGPRKILQYMEPRYPKMILPAPSTTGDLLKRRGLVKAKRGRRKHVHPGVVPPVTRGPNDIWAADFKGQFKTTNGIYCYPLTITDVHSRSLLTCHGLLSTKLDGVLPQFDRAFRDFGLPSAIRTDNGPPFAGTGLHGLSQLNVWWIRLGIQHQRIQPSSPQQNGQHERMHRTMKAEATKPPRSSIVTQQREFDRFRKEFNNIRPHESLGGKTPSVFYKPSPRKYSGKIEPYEYPGHFQIKRVTSAGTIRLRNRLVFISSTLAAHLIGLEEINTGLWSVYLHNVLLARIDERDFVVRG